MHIKIHLLGKMYC